MYTIVFGAFVFYTVKYIDYIPYPKRLSEDHRKKWVATGLDTSTLKDGDLVLRHSKGFVSDAILTFSTNDPQYSHSGIFRRKQGKPYVMHATGGEENVSNEMKWEPLELYCHPSAVFKFAVYRYDLPPEQLQHFLSLMDGYYKKGVEFDLDFDMYTDDKMYCSEMIYKALAIATNDENYVPLSEVLDKPYVAIDNLYLNDHCNLIFNYDYD